MGRINVNFWVWTHAIGAGQRVARDAKRKILAGFVGDENIVDERDGFVPPDASTTRSEPAYLFRLNETGMHLFNEGFVGRPPDFYTYHFAARPANEAADGDPTRPFSAPNRELPPDILSLLSEPRPTFISQLPGHHLRVIKPGDMITLDYIPSRFNISVDANGAIIRTGFY